MPTKTEQYKNEVLVEKAQELRTKHNELKNAIHSGNVRHQTEPPSRKEMISMGTVYTKLKENGVRLCKLRDKKEAKAQGKSNPSKLRVVKVDAALSQFLRLKERGLPEDMYPDTLVTSYFANWVVIENRQKGTEVKLNGPDDPFVKLFLEDLQKPGSGPTLKDEETGEETETAVLDANGKQINPLKMNKHMFIFASHYIRKMKTVNGKSAMRREVVSKADYPDEYARILQEHHLLTEVFKSARKDYVNAKREVARLQEGKEKAVQVGDVSINDSIQKANAALRKARNEYVALLNKNLFKHSIA